MKLLKSKTKLMDSWIWNDEVERFVAKHVKGYSLNVCSGKSNIGDVKVDLDPEDKSIIRADMINLPFADNIFDTVIQELIGSISVFRKIKDVPNSGEKLTNGK